MRLINVNTVEIEDFTLRDKPEYAILSHTWEDDEVSYQDMQQGLAKSKKGYAKIVQTCQLAIQSGRSHVWVDTCCIDKTSSAELSEAINSMFRWYAESEVCYAFLADLKLAGYTSYEKMMTCRWWSRGWTLQELLAPKTVWFYDCQWRLIGDRIQHATMIPKATKIRLEVLTESTSIHEMSVATRMSRGAQRVTTKPEDEAHSLHGLFDASMPLIYGKGRKAFRRLLKTIINYTNGIKFLACEARQILYDSSPAANKDMTILDLVRKFW